MKTWNEVAQWCAGAAEAFGDPSVPVCQAFFRWQDVLTGAYEAELVVAMVDGEVTLRLGPDFPDLPMPIVMGGARVEGGELVSYGAQRITAGVWALDPSLNIEGLIHAFVVLHGVPDPAPWERRIVLP